MRRRNRRAGRWAALALVGLVFLAARAEASARGGGAWRSTRYGRKGAEIWAEFPRVALAAGNGYRDEYDAGVGLGFGFGIMFATTDNIAFEGRLLQSNHSIGAEEKQWDLDLLQAGARYTFLTEDAFQPFVGAGFAKLGLERDAGIESSDVFERLTGYGGYATAGLDFIYSSSWSAFLRADYVLGGYGHRTHGTEEESFDRPPRGDTVSLTLGVAYRIPAW